MERHKLERYRSVLDNTQTEEGCGFKYLEPLMHAGGERDWYTKGKHFIKFLKYIVPTATGVINSQQKAWE
jgi:hypothetical protein